MAELQVARSTGLAPPDLALVDRSAGPSGSRRDLRDPQGLPRPAGPMGEALDARREELPDARPDGRMLAQLARSARCAGRTVLGVLGKRAFGQFDVPVPRSGPAGLLFVTDTIETFEREWWLDPTEFRTAVALHEVAHRFELAAAWARERFAELLHDFLLDDGRRRAPRPGRFPRLDPIGPRGGAGARWRRRGSVRGGARRRATDQAGPDPGVHGRLRGVGRPREPPLGAQLLPNQQIEEAVRRSETPTDPVFERLLGIEITREHYEDGRRFCDTVALADEPTLARMWDSAEAHAVVAGDRRAPVVARADRLTRLPARRPRGLGYPVARHAASW